MSILDKLKEFFSSLRKKEQKLFLPTNEENINSGEEFRKGYAAQVIENPKEPSLEECIEEFIAQYAIQEQVNPNSHHKSYNAFRRMFCSEEEELGVNDKNQRKLMEQLQKRGYTTSPQVSKGRVAFMHISGRVGINEKKDRDVEKIYLNCDRKNIALLTGAIYRAISDVVGDKLQMKFVSEQCYDFLEEANEENKIVKNYQRNDRIVIYAENHAKAEQIAEKIQELRRINPQLFSTTRTVPLLPKKMGFLGIGKEKRGTIVKTPLGDTTGVTYNDLLAEVMFKSTVAGFDIGVSGMVLSKETGEKTPEQERMRQYAEVFDKMGPEQRRVIISKSKDFFLQICRENKINTIYTPTMDRENETTQSL